METAVPTDARTRPPWASAAISLAAVVLGVVLVARTWLAMGDVLVDSGRELYVPWRILAGDVLYRDLAYFNGPLSPYWNACAFAIFGTGYRTLVIVNLCLLACFGVLLHRLLARLGGELAASIALVYAVGVFLLPHGFGYANYNFVSPYSHEMTHGLMLATATLFVGFRADLARRGPALATGTLLGLVFLTKAEIFVATAAAVVVLLVHRRPSRRSLAFGALGFTLVVAIACVSLATAMPIGDAVHSTLGSWTGIGDSRISALPFYRVGLGIDEPGRNLVRILGALAAVFAAFVPAVAVGLPIPRTGKWTLPLAVAVGLTVMIGWLFLGRQEYISRPLPIVLGLAVVVLVRARRCCVERLAFVTFAFVLLAKMVLNVRFDHYGFVLALPAAMALVLLTTAWIPGSLRERKSLSGLVLASAIGLLTAEVWEQWTVTDESLAKKTVEFGRGPDRLVTDIRGLLVTSTLEQIERRLPKDATILVLPEGITINYWARRRTPTPYLNFMPPELILFGEDAMLEALERSPPAAVVLVHKDTSEYGVPLFGRDYGQRLMAWVRSRYHQTWVDPRADQPLVPGARFGIAILER